MKRFLTTLAILVTVATMAVNVEGATKKKKDACHLREIDNCLDKMRELGKRKEPSVLIASDSGLDTICKTVREELRTCIKNFAKKCGTPLHRELVDLVIDQIDNRVGKTCNVKAEARKEFLKHSPCMHKKVFSTPEYKATCNNQFLATIDKLNGEADSTDKSYDTICCGYKRWDSCVKKMITKECGKDGYNSFTHFLGESFGTLAHMACPKGDYSTKTDLCKKLLPKDDTKAVHVTGENALTKYVTSLFSFLFILDK